MGRFVFGRCARIPISAALGICVFIIGRDRRNTLGWCISSLNQPLFRNENSIPDDTEYRFALTLLVFYVNIPIELRYVNTHKMRTGGRPTAVPPC